MIRRVITRTMVPQTSMETHVLPIRMTGNAVWKMTLIFIHFKCVAYVVVETMNQLIDQWCQRFLHASLQAFGVQYVCAMPAKVERKKVIFCSAGVDLHASMQLSTYWLCLSCLLHGYTSSFSATPIVLISFWLTLNSFLMDSGQLLCPWLVAALVPLRQSRIKNFHQQALRKTMLNQHSDRRKKLENYNQVRKWLKEN